MSPSEPGTQPGYSYSTGSDLGRTSKHNDGGDVTHTTSQTGRTLWKFHMRPDDDDDEDQDWWFASTAIPLLAATTGPLANMLSIAALVSKWRCDKPTGHDYDCIGFADPRWCIALNAASLICGFVGNFFLLLNFTRRVRYIIALPMTIVLWYIATAILIAIIAAMNIYVPPTRPAQTYSQGFWYAIIAAVLYLLSSMILMVNMLGYFLGHYPQHFTLTDHQRTLILQTMMFFLWLAGGAGVFARVCGWSYVDALYFCDVTILTVGFGDYSAPNDVGRGLVFPFSVGGIIMLGLMVGSINRFSSELSHDKVIKKHVEKQRVRTIDRSVTRSIDLPRSTVPGQRPKISAPSMPRKERTTIIDESRNREDEADNHGGHDHRGLRRLASARVARPTRRREPRIILLREERDRFNAMRDIQHHTRQFQKWYNLSISVTAFGLLWCVGAVVFWKAEASEQGLSYFQSLYFCYVSLLTIGYGDLSPKSNAGKPFFVVWSLVAVPTMTILITDMGETVIASFKRGTFRLADFTVLPKAGLWKSLLDKNPWLLFWVQKKLDERRAEKRIEQGFPLATVDDAAEQQPTLEALARGDFDEQSLARRLAIAIRHTANHLGEDPPRRYTYEQWVEYTRLIRFSSKSAEEVEGEEDSQGLIEWDWIGEDSPMMADETEAEWVLDRLCESLDRYMMKQAPKSTNPSPGGEASSSSSRKTRSSSMDRSVVGVSSRNVD
ncbi:MAG: hypothetical protein M1825_005627 [Sarcosagium campestre]|nr:MAG: hypothetical protein M1825_005627 [Sarcosagium campestre]